MNELPVYGSEQDGDQLVRDAEEALHFQTTEKKQEAKNKYKQAALIYGNCQLPEKAKEAQKKAESIVV